MPSVDSMGCNFGFLIWSIPCMEHAWIMHGPSDSMRKKHGHVRGPWPWMLGVNMNHAWKYMVRRHGHVIDFSSFSYTNKCLRKSKIRCFFSTTWSRPQNGYSILVQLNGLWCFSFSLTFLGVIIITKKLPIFLILKWFQKNTSIPCFTNVEQVQKLVIFRPHIFNGGGKSWSVMRFFPNSAKFDSPTHLTCLAILVILLF